MSSVSVRDLEISFGAQAVLQHLDLDVHEGEFLVLLGPSGCGKSTLLHAIAGLLDVSDGSIHIGDRDVTFEDPKDRAIGMVFQSYALYPTMNVERNMSFGLRVAGVPKSEITRRVDKAAKMLQLEPLLRRKPAHLSGGQRQRVAIGRALVREAKVFLFDEPLSNLDAKLRTDLRREIKQLHQELGATMVYVTHDQVEAMTLASRVAVMRGGRIQQIGTPAQVYAQPANMFVAGFLGSPSMNFIEGRLERADAGGVRFEAPGVSVPVPAAVFATAPLPQTAAVLGLRPEHITLRAAEGATVTAEVTLVEPLGAQAIVWLQTPSQALAVTVGAGGEPALGQRVGLDWDTARASAFDPASGERL